jgi:hypothetical protein
MSAPRPTTTEYRGVDCIPEALPTSMYHITFQTHRSLDWEKHRHGAYSTADSSCDSAGSDEVALRQQQQPFLVLPHLQNIAWFHRGPHCRILARRSRVYIGWKSGLGGGWKGVTSFSAILNLKQCKQVHRRSLYRVLQSTTRTVQQRIGEVGRLLYGNHSCF